MVWLDAIINYYERHSALNLRHKLGQIEGFSRVLVLINQYNVGQLYIGLCNILATVNY